MKSCVSPYRFRDGFRDGIPIGLGYLSVSFGFGISAVGQGLYALEAVLISMTNLTSAGQIAGLTIIAAGGTVLEMLLTQLVINLRYALMGISLTQKLDDHCTAPRRLYLSFALTDEIYAVASAKPYSVGSSYLRGLIVAPYIGWAGGTLLGACAGQIMPPELQSAAGLMIYAMFIAILIPPMKHDRGILLAAALSAVLSCIISYVPVFQVISDGFSIIICSVIAAVVLSLMRPIAEETEVRGDADKS